MIILGQKSPVILDKEKHEYWLDSKPLKSISKILDSLEPDVDFDKIAGMIGKRDAGQNASQEKIDEEIKKIKDEWEQTKQDSLNHGAQIDGLFELAIKGYIPEEIKTIFNEFYERFGLRHYYKHFPKQILYDETAGTAGESDLILQRQRTNNSFIDIVDYKTGLKNKIRFDSISRKDPEKWKHYNRKFKEPVSHLECCSYTRDALQLSFYAWMLEHSSEYRIGRLAIIFVSDEIEIIPIPYLRNEVMDILVHEQIFIKDTVGEIIQSDW